MKIGLVDVDSHNFPNLPLMKISAFHKGQGDDVEFAQSGGWYDRVYMSKVFTESNPPPNDYFTHEIIRGGSGYDLDNKLPYEIEHQYPDYSLYPQFHFAVGWLTRGCPRCNHTFCITPQKDGCKSIKVADLSEFWTNQKEIKLLDQNILACSKRVELLEQLIDSKAKVEFSGGLDVRFVNQEIAELLTRIKIPVHHFAWDDPREELEEKYKFLRKYLNVHDQNNIVYVLTNFWSTHEEDLYRIYTLRRLGYSPFVMIYDKQKFVDNHGRWLPDVKQRFTSEQIYHFKVCQHMQRWCNSRAVFRTVETFGEYMKGRNLNLPK